MNEVLKKLLEKLKGLKKVEATGFANEADANAYLSEREQILEDIGKALVDYSESVGQEVEALKAQLGEAMKKMSSAGPVVKELDRNQMLADIGKTVAAAWRKNAKAMNDLGHVPNFDTEKNENWHGQRDFVFNAERGGFTKAAVGDPFGQTSDGAYIINPIYSRELMRYAVEKSDMMDLVRNVPMAAPEISYPSLKRYTGALRWLSAYGEQISQAGKPEFGARVVLQAKTLAGYIPWYDEFEDDMQVNITLGEMFMEMFGLLYSEEFDYQCLLANGDPFKGIFKMTGAGECIKAPCAGPLDVDTDFLKSIPLRIPRADRKGGMWLVSEEYVAYLMSMRNTMGDFLIQPPNDSGKIGKIVGFPYRECRTLPGIGEVNSGDAFMWFGDPKRHIWHGDRKEVEIRQFKETSESLLYGENFIRFRKRDGFKCVQTDLSVLVTKR